MKKFFTLIAVALVAISASAQESEMKEYITNGSIKYNIKAKTDLSQYPAAQLVNFVSNDYPNGSEGEITQEYTEAGGRTTFKVSTNASDYKLVDVPSWCSIEKKTPTEFTLVCTPNESSNPRHYFFEVKASERKSQKITIVQAPASSASATINKVWAEEYAFFLTKGIRIHIDTKVNGLMNQDVYYSVLFYQADNKTPLMGKDGQQVTMSGSEFSEFDETHWSDWYVSIPYQYFPKDPDGGGRYTFDCIIKDAHGKELARSRNHSFSLP